jgi:hypothetical protein
MFQPFQSFKLSLCPAGLPARSKIESVKNPPGKGLPVGDQDVKDCPKYEKMWTEIFGLR